jgi:hypothetical protein
MALRLAEQATIGFLVGAAVGALFRFHLHERWGQRAIEAGSVGACAAVMFGLLSESREAEPVWSILVAGTAALIYLHVLGYVAEMKRTRDQSAPRRKRDV